MRSSCSIRCDDSGRPGWYVARVSGKEVSNEASLSPPEAVLVDVVRMILRDRADEVPERVRKLVSTPAGRRQGKLSGPARAALALVLTEESSGATKPARRGRMRSAAPAAASADDTTIERASALRPVLADVDADAVDRIVREYRERDRLVASGLRPTRTALFSGPPGVGKTMTMQFIADALDRPFIRVEPGDVIGSLLGESARALSATFREARDRGAVLILDEVDALAKRRDDLYDVGEFKRFVTTLLVELDRWGDDAPLLAATNHLELLDRALERRFEAHVQLGPPDEAGRREMLTGELRRLSLRPSPGVVEAIVAVTAGQTGAAIADLVHRAARRVVLDDEPLDRALLDAALPADRSKLDRRSREQFAAAAQDHAGLSARRIGALLDCSHTAALRLARAGAATTNEVTGVGG